MNTIQTKTEHRERFAILVERLANGDIEVGPDSSLSEPAAYYIAKYEDEIFEDTPVTVGTYLAEGTYTFWSLPADMFNPAESEEDARVHHYKRTA